MCIFTVPYIPYKEKIWNTIRVKKILYLPFACRAHSVSSFLNKFLLKIYRCVFIINLPPGGLFTDFPTDGFDWMDNTKHHKIQIVLWHSATSFTLTRYLSATRIILNTHRYNYSDPTADKIFVEFFSALFLWNKQTIINISYTRRKMIRKSQLVCWLVSDQLLSHNFYSYRE